MSTPQPESKTERLILNFTVQERHTLKELYLRSHSVSESDFVRRAVELYADLHRRVVSGGQIVLRNDAKRQQTGVVITKHWSRDTMAPPDRQSPRQNFELKIEGSAKQTITRMVQAGAAPSAARLAWAAIGAYALIIENTEQGFVLMEKKDGQFAPILQPSSRHDEPNAVKGRTYPSHSGFIPGKIIDLYTALHWEEIVKAITIWFVSPVQTPKRFPSVTPKLVVAMKARFLGLTEYIWLLDSDEKDAQELSQWLYDTFYGTLSLSDYDANAQAILEARIAALPAKLQELARACPVFALVKIATRARNGSSVYDFIEAAKRIKTYWLAELPDNSIEGLSFIGPTDHLGADPDGAQLMGMAEPDAAMILADLKKMPTRLSAIPMPKNQASTRKIKTIK